MRAEEYAREPLAAAVAASSSWAGVLRALGLECSGGRRRSVQRAAREHDLDTAHFTRQHLRYSDEAIAAAVASSSTLREVAVALGAAPAPGTLSHLRRRIRAAGLTTDHLPGLNRPCGELPFTAEELATAAASEDSVRGVARALGVPDDGRTRAALRRMLTRTGTDTSHFRHARRTLPDDALRRAVSDATSYAGVVRALGLPVNDASHRRVQRRAARLGLDTSHFTRRSRRVPRPAAPPRRIAGEVLRIRPEGSPRVGRERLHRALAETGVRYACATCGNPGQWRGRPVTLQIDHIDGNWLDNRAENLRYLCPNCHAITDTWCRSRRSRSSRSAPTPSE
ncbi:HNH endonuclease signature motif containing protein [Streptomyces sp. bgisy100]|uniref:HNH endonuclease signature motif containing protein n=1 Tax=Streptomyces sp. bgisy100 TaxID=3413783 RepID=UPI003D742264